ncbi:MAG: DUF1887 family CARF protein [Clostridia bacterium]|nr:DUF1887 family CARF protein [Clostridia bacterium]
MKTLIKLYEDRSIENVISAETFLPEQVIYLCSAEEMPTAAMRKSLKTHFAARGLQIKPVYKQASIYKTDKILKQMTKLIAQYPDCAVDITGGTDAALFAAGMLSSEKGTPAFTYSRKQNRFYNIMNAPFADDRICTLNYTVEDFFRIAGGRMRPGRVDNKQLGRHLKEFDGFFSVYLRWRREWTDAVVFFQRISQQHEDEPVSLAVSGERVQKGERGKKVTAPAEMLTELAELGFLLDLDLSEPKQVSFRFADEQVRFWLRDIGSVLELYIYKACIDADIFHDVVSSAIVDWDGTDSSRMVTNEIDAVAGRGTLPIFISCKTCEIKTEALNELAILRDRFGGKGAKAVMVTSENCGSAARHRAAQLQIAVIDREELKQGKAAARLRVIMKVDDALS